MNKIVFILILFFPYSINSEDISDCLKDNNGDKTLSNCLTHNDKETKENNVDRNKIFCCLLSLKFKNGTEKSYCMTAKKNIKDSIDSRVEMFEYQKGVEKASINCSSKYLFISVLLVILIFI